MPAVPSESFSADHLNELLGYLNFSTGKRDPTFFSTLNTLAATCPADEFRSRLQQQLLAQLPELKTTQPAFANSGQVERMIPLWLEKLPQAYQEFHADLLGELPEHELAMPFLLGEFAESLLQQDLSEPEETLLTKSLQELNHFVGCRPVATLENDQQTHPYSHEFLCTVPLYLDGVGISHGPYEELLTETMNLFRQVPQDLCEQSHFHLDQVREITLDPRAYDSNHPVYKRTNYLFGEWDSRSVGLDGYYHRFVIRKVVIDSLVAWTQQQSDIPKEEVLHDAAAALCGTILMASSISGSGPETFDSTISLSDLLPAVARYRDAFYEYLISQAQGDRKERLQQHREKTHQPFGHVRQYLNMALSGYTAQQVRYRELANLFARLGQPKESLEYANKIPACSIRFETEFQIRCHAGRQAIDAQDIAAVEAELIALESLWQRGIDCGAFVDPWNILGFQGQFPLFHNREDSVPDIRIEVLIDLTAQLLQLFSEAMHLAAVQGQTSELARISERFGLFAEQWDKYGTTAISDVSSVKGMEEWESARVVTRVLAQWRQAGESAGDISFWRDQVADFSSSATFASLVQVLLKKQDFSAVQGLLLQWLNQAEEVGHSTSHENLFNLLMRWFTQTIETTQTATERYRMCKRLFSFLEANAETMWNVPKLSEYEFGEQTDDSQPPQWNEQTGTYESNEDAWREDDDDDDDDLDGEQDLFSAAYDDMVFRDTADDGQQGEVFEPSSGGNHEFEQLNRQIEHRIRFQQTLSSLWLRSVTDLGLDLGRLSNPDQPQNDSEFASLLPDIQETMQEWYQEIITHRNQLDQLLNTLWGREIEPPTGDHDSNVEFDMEMQTKMFLINNIIWTRTRFELTATLLQSLPFATIEMESKFDRHLQRFLQSAFSQEPAEARERLVLLLGEMINRPLLYVPLENDGHPMRIAEAQQALSIIRWLMVILPRLGLYRETCQVLRTAQRMERRSKPKGQSITEFDRLFALGFQETIRAILNSSENWRSGKIKSTELIQLISEVVSEYAKIWVRHARGMRLAAVESLNSSTVWEKTALFIEKYGAELFHARNLTLGNVRAIVHGGVENFLDHLLDNPNPLRPLPLVEAIDDGKESYDDAANMLDLIYSAVIDKFDRFLEYNSTTTHSDYGERFLCFLDFIKMEASYDRDEWVFQPWRMAHEILVSEGHFAEAEHWAQLFRSNTKERSGEHLSELERLEQTYGVHLPGLADHIREQFIKPLNVHAMVAILKLYLSEHDSEIKRERFEDLLDLIDEYLESSAGTGIDVPEWLQLLDDTVSRHHKTGHVMMHSDEFLKALPTMPITLREFRSQLKKWNEPLEGKKSTSKKPRSSDDE